MSCSKPLHAYVTGITKSGKKKLTFTGQNKALALSLEGRGCEYVEIPCGRCIGCRLDYSKRWADRCMLELQKHDSSYFLTLTYEDPPKHVYRDEFGKEHTSYSLEKKHLQDFFKRLRYYYPENRLSYLACSEYGEGSKRPHYHAIVFGLKLDDLKYYKRNKQGDIYWISDKLTFVWQTGDDVGDYKRGFVVVGEANWQTCAYVSRYVLKKAKGSDSNSYKTFNLEPEQIFMSKNPAIGKETMKERASEFYSFGKVYVPTSKGSIEVRTPRYLDELMLKIDKSLVEDVKERRKEKAKENIDSKLEKTDLSLEELRKVEENNLIEKTKALRREL